MLKKIRAILIFAFFLILSSNTFSQEVNPWESYIINKDRGYMDVSVNMKYEYGRPNYKNLLIVGAYTRKCHKNGYPTQEGLETLYSFSDSIATIVDKITKNRLVGVLTYQCTGFDVFYVKDTLQLRENINQFINKERPNAKSYVTMARDKKWSYYNDKLYPKNASFDFFTNHDFLRALFYQGDGLAQKRKVRHWVQFKKPKRRQQFIKKMAPLEFKVDSLKFNKKEPYPYELQIYRDDGVDPEAVANFTLILNKLASMFYGVYDGWSAQPALKD